MESLSQSRQSLVQRHGTNIGNHRRRGRSLRNDVQHFFVNTKLYHEKREDGEKVRFAIPKAKDREPQKKEE